MKITVRYFNMVELALAMAVLAIGISSILVLFPVGINASTNARANDQVPMIADVVLENIKNIAMKVDSTDWTTMNAGIPTAKPSNSDIYNIVASDPDHPVLGNLYATGTTGVFLYKNGDDFNAAIRFWRDDYDDFQIGTKDADATALQKVAALIFVEISWPIDMTYTDRVAAGNVRTYRLELFNQVAQ